MDLVTQRFVCEACDVLATGDRVCFCCGQPMVSATHYRPPTSASYRNPVLALINQETP